MSFEDYVVTVLNAIHNDDVETLKTTIDVVDSNNTFRINGMSLLQEACTVGQLNATRFLIEHGADVGYKDNEGDTPLHQAVNNDIPELISYLFSHGADINAQNNNGITPLMAASYLQKSNVVQELLNLGADIDISAQGHTALGWALANGATPNTELLLKLLKKGANTNELYDNYCAFGYLNETSGIVQHLIPRSQIHDGLFDVDDIVVVRCNPYSQNLGYIFENNAPSPADSTTDSINGNEVLFSDCDSAEFQNEHKRVRQLVESIVPERLKLKGYILCYRGIKGGEYKYIDGSQEQDIILFGEERHHCYSWNTFLKEIEADIIEVLTFPKDITLSQVKAINSETILKTLDDVIAVACIYPGDEGDDIIYSLNNKYHREIASGWFRIL